MGFGETDLEVFSGITAWLPFDAAAMLLLGVQSQFRTGQGASKLERIQRSASPGLEGTIHKRSNAPKPNTIVP